MDTKIDHILLICKKLFKTQGKTQISSKKPSKLRQKWQNFSSKTQNSSKKFKVSANSFGRVAKNRSKLEACSNSNIYFCNALISDFTKISTFPLIPTFLGDFCHVPITNNATLLI